VGLVLPETKKIETKIFHKFIPKQKIHVGDKIRYFDEHGLGELTILGLSIQGVEAKDTFVHVNHGEVRMQTDHELQGREVLYRPATDPTSQ